MKELRLSVLFRFSQTISCLKVGVFFRYFLYLLTVNDSGCFVISMFLHAMCEVSVFYSTIVLVMLALKLGFLLFYTCFGHVSAFHVSS